MAASNTGIPLKRKNQENYLLALGKRNMKRADKTLIKKDPGTALIGSVAA